jgi:cell division septation protein DedD
VTTSSPESEPHVEHTITANGIRHGHTGGLVLRQLHIGLAVGFAIVACLTAFGGGMIVGMWYKASEQTSPLSTAGTAAPEQPAPSQETASQPPEPPAPVTFYNTLTSNNMAYAPLTPPAPAAPAAGHARGAVAPAAPAAGPTSVAKAAVAGPAPAREAATAAAPESAKTVTTVKTTPSAGSPTRTAAGRASQKPAKATPPPKAAPAEGTPPAAQKPAGKDSGARRPAPAPAATPAKAPAVEDFSVQVGSFGNSESAERLRTNLTQKGYPARVQLSSVPGKGLRYRVRVGSYSERASADQTAHHLTAQEQVPAIVAGKD